MERDQRQQLRTITDDVANWVGQARSILTQRAKVDKAADDATGTLRRAVVDARRDGTVEWRALPLSAADSQLLGALAQQAHQPPLASDESRTLDRLTTEVPNALHDVKAIVGTRRFFSGSKKRDAGQASAELITKFRDWGASTGVPHLLQRLDKHGDNPTEVSVADALADWVGLRPRVTDLGSSAEVVARAVVAELPAAIKTIEKALMDEARFRSDASLRAIRSASARSVSSYPRCRSTVSRPPPGIASASAR